MTSTIHDAQMQNYTEEWVPSPEDVPSDHWSKTTPPRTQAELDAEIDARLATRGIVQQSPTPVPTVKPTHDLQMESCTVPWGFEARPDPDKVAAHNARRTESARRAKAERAAPTGPRSDEKEGWVPDGTTTGPVNAESTGCAPIEWRPPTNGRWVSNGRGSERFVPDPSPVFTHSEKPDQVPVQKEPVYEGWLENTSQIGAKSKGKQFALPTGCAPVEWVDPAEKK